MNPDSPARAWRMSRVPWNFGWRSCDPRATCSSLSSIVVTPATQRSRASRSAGRWRKPFTFRNCFTASVIPAAHQRSVISSSRQRFTFAQWSRHISIIDSTGFVERRVRARVGGTPSR